MDAVGTGDVVVVIAGKMTARVIAREAKDDRVSVPVNGMVGLQAPMRVAHLSDEKADRSDRISALHPKVHHRKVHRAMSRLQTNTIVGRGDPGVKNPSRRQ